MISRFADTFYFLALLNKDDEAHEIATRFALNLGGRLVTTDWVITEVADALGAGAAPCISAVMARDPRRRGHRYHPR